jgi:hypothetical protein
MLLVGAVEVALELILEVDLVRLLLVQSQKLLVQIGQIQPQLLMVVLQVLMDKQVVDLVMQVLILLLVVEVGLQLQETHKQVMMPPLQEQEEAVEQVILVLEPMVLAVQEGVQDLELNQISMLFLQL